MNFIYDDVKFSTINGEDRPTSIYKKNDKWGIVTVGGHELVPFIYFDIIEIENSGSYLVEFEEDKFGYISILTESSYVNHKRENYASNSIVIEHFKREKTSNNM